MSLLLWIAIIIVILWLLGFVFSIGGGFVHLLLVIAVIVIIVHFLQRRSG